MKRITDAGVAVWYYLDDRRAAMDSALAKVMASLSGFASESERELARARTYDALARKAKAGHVTGGLVYRYTNARLDGHVERRIDETEAAAVRRLFTEYANGLGPRAIVRALVAEGAPPPTPRRPGGVPGWSPAAVREILARPLYTGLVVWNRRKKTDRGGRTKVRLARPPSEWVTVEVPALRIVDEATWQAVQARRAELSTAKPAGTWTRSTRVARPALLSGLGRCGVCGSGLVRASRASARGTRGARSPCTPVAGPLGGCPVRTAWRSRRRRSSPYNERHAVRAGQPPGGPATSVHRNLATLARGAMRSRGARQAGSADAAPAKP